MSRSAAPPAPAGRARKSPLRLSIAVEPSFPLRQPNSRLSPEQLRAMMISEFEQWLRSRTSRRAATCCWPRRTGRCCGC
jgi:hypothetical protein